MPDHQSLPEGKCHLNTFALIDVSYLDIQFDNLKIDKLKSKDIFKIKQIKNNENEGDW